MKKGSQAKEDLQDACGLCSRWRIKTDIICTIRECVGELGISLRLLKILVVTGEYIPSDFWIVGHKRLIARHSSVVIGTLIITSLNEQN